MRGKGKVCIRDGTVVSGRFIFANDNFVVANDNTFAGDVALAGPSGEDGPGGWVLGASLFAVSVVPLLAIAYRRIASKLG